MPAVLAAVLMEDDCIESTMLTPSELLRLLDDLLPAGLARPDETTPPVGDGFCCRRFT